MDVCVTLYIKNFTVFIKLKHPITSRKRKAPKIINNNFLFFWRISLYATRRPPPHPIGQATKDKLLFFILISFLNAFFFWFTYLLFLRNSVLMCFFQTNTFMIFTLFYCNKNLKNIYFLIIFTRWLYACCWPIIFIFVRDFCDAVEH